MSFNKYLSGLNLIGDDYTPRQILRWYSEEKDAYVDLIPPDDSYEYEYFKLNDSLGFDKVRYLLSSNSVACCFGSASGDELIPYRNLFKKIILIDSSNSLLNRSKLDNVSRVVSQPLGNIDLDDNSVDLITCFGVLHHIPNVSYVISEFYRILSPGGLLLLREPTTSMGDWRKPRKGVTKNERGIPRAILDDFIDKQGFRVLARTECVFPPLVRIAKLFSLKIFNSAIMIVIDSLLCRLFSFNYSYHRTSFLKKFAPASIFYSLLKNSTL